MFFIYAADEVEECPTWFREEMSASTSMSRCNWCCDLDRATSARRVRHNSIIAELRHTLKLEERI